MPDLSFIAPDIYGARPDYVDRFNTGRNAVFVLNQGVNSYGGYAYCDWPWRIAFALAGAPYNALGINLFRLVGDPPWNDTTPLFWGLVNSGSGIRPPWFKDYTAAWQWFPWAYAVRNSVVGLRAVADLIPDTQGTTRLVSFMAGYGPFAQVDRAVLVLDNLHVEVKLAAAAECDSDWSTFGSGSRGLLLQSAERDLTLVGVGYTATLQVDTRAWALRTERGWWEGTAWHRTGEVIAGTVAVDDSTGFVTVQFSADDLANQDSSALQYVVRVYDAGQSTP